jgi:predicted RNase H-like HicB family nuclease
MGTEYSPPYVHKVFLDEPSGEYVAECLEIPGLSGVGETEAEAVAALTDAISGWLEVLKEDGLPFPPPLSDVKGDCVFAADKAKSEPRTTATGETSTLLQNNYPGVLIEPNRPKENSSPRTTSRA